MAKTTESQYVHNEQPLTFIHFAIPFILFCVVVSVFTHHPEDMNLLSGGFSPVTACQNLLDFGGAWIAQSLYLMFGLAVWPLLIMTILWAFRPFFKPRPRRPVVPYITAVILTIFGLTILLAMWPQYFVFDMGPFAGTASLGIGSVDAPEKALSGGTLGQILAAPPIIDEEIRAGYLRALIGEFGTFVVAATALLFGLIMLIIIDWKSIIVKCLDARPDIIEDDEPQTQVSPFQVRVVTPPPPPEPPEKPIPPPEPVSVEPRFIEPLREEEGVTEEDDLAPSGDSVSRRAAPMFRRPANADNTIEPQPEVKATTMAAAVEKIDPLIPKVPVEMRVPQEPKANADDLYGERVAKAAAEGSRSTPKAPKATDEHEPFTLPPISMLTKVPDDIEDIRAELEFGKERLEDTLQQFKINAWVENTIVGPRIVRYDLMLDSGVDVKEFAKRSGNLKMNLKAESIRILAPVPGKSFVGIEVPNPKPTAVYMRQIMESKEWRETKAEIPIVLGKDVAGNSYVADLARMPHLLIAGATGAGKSVCMNTLVMSLLFRFTPDELRMIMVDPKVVEMAMYQKLPHLITPVLNDAAKVPLALRWGVAEMERRYRIMAKVLVKNLAGFNKRPIPDEPVYDDTGAPIPAKLPYLVIIVDELADMMMTDARKDVETAIARIAQKGRAAGIHLVIATQRPSREIVTGVIKANLPTRIAFRVGSQIDSRVILDQSGAEELLGKGDMLFVAPGGINIERVQGAMVEDDNIEAVVKFISGQRDQRFLDDVVRDENEEEAAAALAKSEARGLEDDGLPDAGDPSIEKYVYPGDGPEIRQALEILYRDRKISTSYLQRCLGIGYNSAAKIMDTFEQRGYISGQKEGGAKRDSLIFDELNQHETP